MQGDRREKRAGEDGHGQRRSSVEVLSGVQAGEQVVTRGGFALRDGRPRRRREGRGGVAMFLSNLSIKRPVVATVMMLALVTLGLFSCRRLPIDMMPDVEIPVLSIITEYPGASPETVEREVSKKIEEAVNPIAGVKHVNSISREGLSSVIVEFNLEVKINDVSQEARAKINAIRRELPEGMKEPVIQKFDFDAMPIVSLAVRSNDADAARPDDAGRPEDQAPPGEHPRRRARRSWSASSKREVAVNLDPARLEALGHGRRRGRRRPRVRERQHAARAPDARRHRDAAAHLAASRATPAEYARDGHRPPRRPSRSARRRGHGRGHASRSSGRSRSSTASRRWPSTSRSRPRPTRSAVVDAVRAAVDALQAELPPGTEIQIVRDTSMFIRESVADVQNTLVLGGLLTILIVFCFLNSWRSTVITGLTLPISVISSFIVMYFLGMTLNMLTLMALSLAIGLLIDDAIVVRENIVRHLEHGRGPLRRRRARARARSAWRCSPPRCRSSRCSCRWPS